VVAVYSLLTEKALLNKREVEGILDAAFASIECAPDDPDASAARAIS
jgi:hypothetical protein